MRRHLFSVRRKDLKDFRFDLGLSEAASRILDLLRAVLCYNKITYEYRYWMFYVAFCKSCKILRQTNWHLWPGLRGDFISFYFILFYLSSSMLCRSANGYGALPSFWQFYRRNTLPHLIPPHPTKQTKVLANHADKEYLTTVIDDPFPLTIQSFGILWRSTIGHHYYCYCYCRVS